MGYTVFFGVVLDAPADIANNYQATSLNALGLFLISSIMARISFSVGIVIIPTAVK